MASIASLDNDSWDCAVGGAFERGEVRMALDHPGIQARPLWLFRDDRSRTKLLSPDLHRDIRIRQQIVVPGGMLIAAAIRCSDDETITVVNVRERMDPRFATFGSTTMQQE